MKKQISDLAYFGGVKLFESVRPIGQLWQPEPDKFFELAKIILKSRRFSNGGPIVKRLEEKLCVLHQVEHAVTYANASIAIIAVLETVAKGRHGEVIMPAFTYSGLPHLAQWAHQYPKFCDIDADTHVLDPQKVGEAITPETTSILAVHQVNSPCYIDELEAVADQRSIPLIFDSVHGIYCTYKGRPVGSFGACEIFSLHATKILNGFEGGYVTTNHAHLAETLRKKRNFGYASSEQTKCIGLNGKLNEFHAALALAGFDDLDEIVTRNKHRVEYYRKAFEGIEGLTWIAYSKKEKSLNYEFALLEISPDWPLTRDEIVVLMREENALARGYYSPPIHHSNHCPVNMTPPRLPVTEMVSERIIQMPVGELMSDRDVDLLAEFFSFIYDKGKEIADKLRQE